MYCQTCGDLIPDDSAFCPSCGKRLVSATPPAEEAPVEYAGFIRRVAACILDSLVITALFFVPATLFGFILTIFMDSSQVFSLLLEIKPIIYIIAFIFSFFYYAYLESSQRQATVGKRAIGIAVTDADGERISFGRATVRYIGKLLSELFFPVFFIIAVTRKKQGLHDMAAGTLVVKKRV
ncbi:zinc-ribbon domain-containing protein [Methanofollis formosanus]|uniref:Zinc-ribbon domain-containing protein n=1 Tax=Methanofollis formosanus TaxID=299308 RepID=A0A8G1EFQ1_9EURY|nr:RDD family protein [Methanofollis formosanus]QYZ78960.1 zinc-ribbon domain-containing protein [Methanofollis formosanus]